MNVAEKTLRLAFETYWKKQHPAKEYPRRTWLKQDDIWGDPGYAQPTVHFDWRAFRSGVSFGIAVAEKAGVVTINRTARGTKTVTSTMNRSSEHGT